MQKLKVSENKRYFVLEDGKPFVWLADTAWTMPQRMKWDDADYYMQTRKSQGFTVLQIVALDPERDVQMRNPSGNKALINDDLNQPNEKYFEYLDWILDQAESYGFYVLLLPVWGQLVVGDDWGGGTYEKTVTLENAFAYGEWIGRRYGHRNNVVWCLGGDRQPIHKGVDYRPVWREMAEGLAKGITGIRPKYNEDHPVWDQLLITYHACHEMETGECSTFSYWTDEDRWIRFIMLQSGHGTKPKNYELVRKAYERERTMPVWDGEPAYEMMPTAWPPKDGAVHGCHMVRKRAYWSLLSGAFGHTYGHASVWCSVAQKERNGFTPVDWFDAIHSEGSAQMKVLRDFMESMKLWMSVPCQERVCMHGPDELDYHIQASVHNNGRYVCAYLPCGGTVTLDLKGLKKDYYIWWMNPVNGSFESSMASDRQALVFEPVKALPDADGCVTLTAPVRDGDNDWVLILHEDGEHPPVGCGDYGENPDIANAKKIFNW